MSGPEHYRVAETLLANLRDTISGSAAPLRTEEQQAQMIAEAHAHAMLAQTAATMELVGATVNGVVTPGWSEAIA